MSDGSGKLVGCAAIVTLGWLMRCIAPQYPTYHLIVFGNVVMAIGFGIAFLMWVMTFFANDRE